MRQTLTFGWLAALVAIVAMVVGHFGDHGLSWKAKQISSYAAIAPYDDLITLSMVSSAGALSAIGILASRYRALGSSYWLHLVPLLAGAAASGLLMLACYEETARTLANLKESGFWAIRQQSFHDAGLLVFYFAAVTLVLMLGVFLVIFRSALPEKMTGLCLFLLAVGSGLLMRTSWPAAIGIGGATVGLKQRASLLFLWMAMLCILAIASRRLQLQAARSKREEIQTGA